MPVKKSTSSTALIRAVMSRNNRAIDAILQRDDINVNLQNKDGNTALILAVRYGNTEIAKKLLSHKDINVNLQNKYGDTALIYALAKDRTEIVEELLSRDDINVNLQQIHGYPALSIVVSKGRSEIIDKFLSREDIIIPHYEKIVPFIKDVSILIKLMPYFTSSLNLNDETEKNHFFYYIATKNPRLFHGLMTSKNLEQDNLVKDAYNYFFAKPGIIIENLAKQRLKADLPEMINKLIQNLKATGSKIQYSQIIPYIYNDKTLNDISLEKLMPFFIPPEKIIAPAHNPIILAARAHSLPVIKYAYKHRQEEPWASFWRQSSDEQNSLLEYFFSWSTGPDANHINAAIFNYILKVPNIIKNISPDLIYGRGTFEHNYYNQRLLSKLKYYVPSMSNSINTWFSSLMKLQEALKGVFRHRKNHGQSAHDEVTAAKALKVSDENFDYELKKNYPDTNALLGTPLEQAAITLRLLILKQLIINDPASNSQYYPGWKKLTELLGMQGYTEAANGKLNTFAEFKNLIFDKSTEVVLTAILTGKDPQDIPAEATQKISDIRNLLDNKNGSLDAKIANSWQAVNPRGEARQNFANKQVNDFVLFCSMLATEDIDYLLKNTASAEDLLKLMSRSIAGTSDKTRHNLVEIIRHKGAKDYNLEGLKQEVRECLLSDQQLMGAAVAYATTEALGDISCPTGVIVRFADDVLDPHHTYSLLQAQDSLMQDKIEDINKIMVTKFSSFLEQKILELLLARLNVKLQEPKPNKIATALKIMRSPKNAFLGYAFNKDKNIKNDTLDKTLAAIKALCNPATKPNTIQELKNSIAKLDPVQVRPDILNTLFLSSTTDDLKKYTAMGSDPEMEKLFDALFSVDEDNWYKLFIGDLAVVKYSALSSKTPEEIKPEIDYIDRYDIDRKSKYNRAKLLKECFSSNNIQAEILDQLKKANPLRPPLHKTEKLAINYYCVAITNPATLKSIASKMLASIDSLKDIEIIAKSYEDKNYQQFIKTLSTTQPQEKMAFTIWGRQLENNFMEAILFEYWREAHPRANIEGFDSSAVRNEISDSVSDDLTIFVKAACKEIIGDDTELKQKLTTTDNPMPILDLIKQLKSEPVVSLRGKIVDDFSLQKGADYKML